MLPPTYYYPATYKPVPYPAFRMQGPVPALQALPQLPSDQSTGSNSAANPSGAPPPSPNNLWSGYYGSSGWQSSPLGIQELNNTGLQWMLESSNRIPWNELIPSITDMGKMGIRALQERLRLRHLLFPESSEVTPPSSFLLQLLDRLR